MDTRDLDCSSYASIIEAAKPFDRSYVEGKSIVMLSGSELYAFCRHYFGPRQSVGRRSADVAVVERLKRLEEENEKLKEDNTLLQSENSIFRHRLLKDRRQNNVPVKIDRRS